MNSKLKRWLQKSKDRNSDAMRKELLQSLLTSPLKVPAINLKDNADPKKGWRVIEEDEKGRIKIIKDSMGRDSIPAFTGDNYLRQWMPEGSYYLTFYGADLCKICLLNNLNSIIVNPGSDLATEISREEVETVVDRN